MKYSGLYVRSVIMHEILSKAVHGANIQGRMSDVPTQLEEEQRLFIQERMRATLGGNARPIVEDRSDLLVPTQVKRYLQGGEEFVALSKNLTSYLQEVQPKASPSGLFLTCECELDNERGLLVAKLEHERGVRAPQTTLPDGRVTFSMELLKDLLFTTASKIYKVAFFSQGDIESETLNGVVVDRQMAGNDIAQYFLLSFLGCKLSERSDLFTQRFFEGVQRFINNVPDAEKKAKYEVALLSEMQRNTTTLSSRTFAADHLDLDDRDELVASLQGSGVPDRPFEKDSTLVKTQLSRIKVETDRGITLLVPPGSMEDGVVSIINLDDGMSTVTVRDKITKFSGAGSIRTQAPPQGVTDD